MFWGAGGDGGGVEGTLRRFGCGFLDCFERINRVTAGLRHVSAMPMSLSTITFTGTLDRGELPVDEMRLAMEVAAELGCPYEFALDCDEAKAAKAAAKTVAAAAKRRRVNPAGGCGTAPGEADAAPAPAAAAAVRGKRFRYQLPLRRNGKSVKLFHNGSVHATGCTSPLEFLEMTEALCAFVQEAGDVCVRLVAFDVQLINTLFLAVDPVSGRPMTIAPGALLRSLGAATRADFDTERHPSVKIPVLRDAKKVATACVFQTGSVSIMGAKRPADVAAAYEMVCTALDACAAAVCAPDTARMRTTTAKQALTLVEGYPFNLYSCCQF